MTFAETEAYLFAQLPMFQRIGASAYKADLSNTHRIMQHLGHPETRFKSIHVGGTNGKGSTSHMLASVLQTAGYKVGLHTSPHLKTFRERIRINGAMISESAVVQFVEKHRQFIESSQASFFEITVGLAFHYFATEQVDIAIIEVGMGGRLDSTNVIHPEISVITNIGLDHQQFLGDTRAKIAGEKAGIIKTRVPVVVGEYDAEIGPVIEAQARKMEAPVFYASQYPVKKTGEGAFTFSWKDEPVSVQLPLPGNYQEQNLKTVLTALESWPHALSGAQLQSGLEQVKQNTGLRGRWEILGRNPTIVADVGHNAHGLEPVMKQFTALPAATRHFVLGFVNDKDLRSILRYFPKDGNYYLCKPDIPRGMETKVAARFFAEEGFTCSVHSSCTEALEAARKKALPADVIFVGGSTFVVAEILPG